MLSTENRRQWKQRTFNSTWVRIHRSVSALLDAHDVIERTYSMWIPGFGTEDPKAYKKILSNDALKAVSRCSSRDGAIRHLYVAVIEDTIHVGGGE